MDLSEANTEAFLRFHRFHEHLNRTIKVSVIGLCFLEDALNKGIDEKTVKDIVYTDGRMWGGMPDWANPKALIKESRKDIGASGILRAFSAFDLFLDNLIADLTAWEDYLKNESIPKDSSFTSEQAKPSIDNEKSDRCTKLCDQRNWSLDPINFLLPVYHYYRIVRNCLAHRNGLISEALSTLSQSAELKSAVEKWCELSSERTSPPINAITVGNSIDVSHKDAILASSVLRRLAATINQYCLTALGEKGVVYLAARRALLDNPPSIRTNPARSASGIVTDALSCRYLVKNIDTHETAKLLSSLKILTRCNERYSQLLKNKN